MKNLKNNMKLKDFNVISKGVMHTKFGKVAKNQFSLFTDKGDLYQSYDSIIALIKDNNITIFKDWDYSQTTMTYLKWFLEEKTGLEWNASRVRKALESGQYEEYKISVGYRAL